MSDCGDDSCNDSQWCERLVRIRAVNQEQCRWNGNIGFHDAAACQRSTSASTAEAQGICKVKVVIVSQLTDIGMVKVQLLVITAACPGCLGLLS